MTEQDFIDAGFRRYARGITPNTRLLQKSYRAANGAIRFFISVDVFDDLIARGSCGFMPIACMTRGEQSFRLTMILHAGDTVAEIEAFMLEAFEALKADPYEVKP